MRIGEIMSDAVETVGPSDPVVAARDRMSFHRIHHLIVMDGREIVGIVSDRDLRRVPADRPVAEVMSTAVVTTEPNATVRQVANLLRGRVVGCLPVVDKRKLVGIVTITDLLNLLGQGAEKPVEMRKRWTLKHRGPRAIQQKRAPARPSR